MKLKGFTLVAGLLMAGATFAAEMSDIDTDGDGVASYDEMIVVYTDLTAEAFAEMDASGDAMLDADEMAAAIEAGLLVEAAD
ncbi:EF-hand domain-containing protein [Actibacterium sp. MT2.3-13A]|uniref:EF-hand domain-containing protein n=1 Tax=Actibacterium sp. MT2.3-13A TaxID=2828332 RepID=UPI0020133AEE|nr:EF-hand domain-containing protein [Actibacterium sp. MT2.3-13A]